MLPDESKTDSQTPKAGDNSQPDGDTVLFFAGQFRRAIAKTQAAQKAFKDVKKAANGAGIVVAELLEIMREQDLEPETLAQRAARRFAYGNALGVKTGIQLTLFDQPISSIPTHTEKSDRAYRAGYAAGIMGDDPDRQAYPVDNEHHQNHMQGWHDGQKVLLDRIGPINDLFTAAEATAKPAGVFHGEAQPD